MKRLLILLFFLLLNHLVIAQYQDNGIGDTIHVIHYNIHLNEIDTDDHTITAFTELTLHPLVDDLQSIPLELKDLAVDSTLVNGASHSFLHEGETLRINLSSQAGINDTLTITVFYQGEPFHEGWGGFHFDGDYAYNLGVGFVSIPHNLGKTWFPCVDDFTDRATYDFYVVADNDKKAICGGTLIDTMDNGDGTKTWHWRIAHPIPTYLASVAVGNYMLYSEEFIGIADTLPIWIYARPSEINKVDGSFVNLKEILQWYEEHFGPYPFSRVGYTGTKIGAMEHATNIAYPHFAINGNTSYESLYTHELAHMWFGDKVTCSSAEDMWLNEGWATFCEIYYLNDLYSYEDFIKKMRHMHREMLRLAHIYDNGYYALNNIPQEYTYGKHAYDKGGSVTNTLRGYLGDSIFFNAMTAYLNHFEYQSVSSEDLRDFLTDHTGVDMTTFFDAWVMTPGTPHFSIDSTKITEGDASFMIDIWLRQRYKGADFFANDNILGVSFIDEDFSFYTDTIHFSGETGHSVKFIEFEPKAIFLDPFEKTGDATTDYFQFFTAAGEYSFIDTYFKCDIEELSDTVLMRTTHHWVAPDSLKNPVESLKLSPNRYWKIEGIYPEDMIVRGKFQFKRAGHLDDELILSDSDSAVILFREGVWDDWHEIPQTMSGLWNGGTITTNDLQPGEYTLAVWDKTIVNTNYKTADNIVSIYPNPSRGKLNFEFVKRSKYNIVIYNVKGAQLARFVVNGKSKSWKWNDEYAFSGVVFIHVYEGNDLLTVRKLVLTK